MNCETFQLVLESHLDGELAPAQAAAVADHAAACSACGVEMRLSAQMLAELHSTEAAVCPDEAYQRALERIRNEAAARPPVGRRTVRLPRLRHALPAAVLVVVLGLAAVQLFARTDQIAYTAEEIALARQQVEMALGLVSDATRNAGFYIRDEIIPEHVLAPLGRGTQPQDQ